MDYSDKIEKLEEAPNNMMSASNLKFLKTEFLDKWRYLKKKLAYPYEYFSSFYVY